MDKLKEKARGSGSDVKRLVMWVQQHFCRHKFYVVQEFGDQTRRVACKKCKRQWGMNDRVQVMVEWDAELADMYFNLFGFREIKPFR